MDSNKLFPRVHESSWIGAAYGNSSCYTPFHAVALNNGTWFHWKLFMAVPESTDHNSSILGMFNWINVRIDGAGKRAILICLSPASFNL